MPCHQPCGEIDLSLPVKGGLRPAETSRSRRKVGGTASHARPFAAAADRHARRMRCCAKMQVSMRIRCWRRESGNSARGRRGKKHNIAVARYLAAHLTTERASVQTDDMARRLMRGTKGHEEAGSAAWRQSKSASDMREVRCPLSPSAPLQGSHSTMTSLEPASYWQILLQKSGARDRVVRPFVRSAGLRRPLTLLRNSNSTRCTNPCRWRPRNQARELPKDLSDGGQNKLVLGASGPRRRSRPKLQDALQGANRISIFLRSRRDFSKASVQRRPGNVPGVLMLSPGSCAMVLLDSTAV